MSNAQKIVERPMRSYSGIVSLVLFFLASAPIVSAQYPSQSQVGKDGTAVMLED